MDLSCSQCKTKWIKSLKGNKSAKFDVQTLTKEALKIDDATLFLKHNFSISEYNKINKLILRRIKGEPIDSIIGYTNFLDLQIKFSKQVLTPRKETEILANFVIEEIKQGARPNYQVLDLCCGSGCIGISIKQHCNVSVSLADISSKALSQCKINMKNNNVKCDIIKSNLFSKINKKFDAIICNPPYIKDEDIKSLENEVKYYDPKLALKGGKDGLKFYRQIISEAPQYLVKNGVIYFEVGQNQSNNVVKLLEEDFKCIKIIKDYGGIERFVYATLKENIC